MLLSIEAARAHLPPYLIDTVVYHNMCADGVISAWTAKNNLPRQKIQFIPASFKTPFRDYDFSQSKYILILDYSFTREQLYSLVYAGKRVLVLDHHLTALEELKDFPFAFLDMQRSGAGLAWNYFFPYTPYPWVIASVQDRDLWRFSFPESKPYNEGLWELLFKTGMYYPFKFWLLPSLIDNHMTQQLIERGREIMQGNQKTIDEACKYALLKTYRHEDRIYKVAYLYLPGPQLRSEIGHALCELKPIDFAFMYWETKEPGLYAFSLRSKGDFDTTPIAKALSHDGKGGGHKNASGGSMDVDPQTRFQALVTQAPLLHDYSGGQSSAAPHPQVQPEQSVGKKRVHDSVS